MPYDNPPIGIILSKNKGELLVKDILDDKKKQELILQIYVPKQYIQ